jgi:hypothetical protein
MRNKPPLTRVDLHSIQERNRQSPDVMALLWEIARLRATVLYAEQLQRTIGSMSGAQGLVLEALRARLANEPCVDEFPRLPPGM